MKINKDLAEAVMMVSCIVLVLIGTTDFESQMTKNFLMIVLGVIAVLMGCVRYFGNKNKTQEN